eukprot:CAMPEP_0178722794 /NCGR_PEP_ID=MMETSP0699-20121125/25183_1 /TAXON_ID=265572 /ORGANISM="Extubocellulus spinifer, Strain CCMP396" /LENGTH=317 /DNA_ID=CAMNT_0020373791 /DNA_START=82 /DNA_END=1035 /DNA_ORIENTATION=-
MYRSTSLLLALLVAAADAQGCPPTSVTFEDYINNRGGTNGACSSNSDCEGNDGTDNPDSTCCVRFTFPYCGVPSSCNPYLSCVSPDVPVPLPSSADAPTPEEFAAALSRAGGGGAYYDGCPPTSESWESYQGKGGACTTNAGCASANEGACCVKYTFPYCGVPGDCNSYLTCMTAEEEAANAVASLQSALPDAPPLCCAILSRAYIVDCNPKQQVNSHTAASPATATSYLTCMTAEEEAANAVASLQSALPDAPPTGEFEAVISALQDCAGATSFEDVEKCAQDNIASLADTSGGKKKERAVSFVVAALAGFGALIN